MLNPQRPSESPQTHQNNWRNQAWKMKRKKEEDDNVYPQLVTGRTPIKNLGQGQYFFFLNMHTKKSMWNVVLELIYASNTKFDLFFLSTRRMLGYLRVKLHNYYSIDSKIFGLLVPKVASGHAGGWGSLVVVLAKVTHIAGILYHRSLHVCSFFPFIVCFGAFNYSLTAAPSVLSLNLSRMWYCHACGLSCCRRYGTFDWIFGGRALCSSTGY